MAKFAPKEALDYVKNKVPLEGFSWKDVWNEEHATGFTVAKATQADVLLDMKAAVENAIEEGQTFDHFRKNLIPTLQSKGWWGRKDMVDPKSGEVVNAQLGSDRRLKTIYDVNTRQAYLKGAWDRGMASTAHPYIMYCLGPSSHHREQHQAWAGLVLPKDDPFWNTHAPMNGWGCKCYLRFLSKTSFDKYQAEGYPVPKNLDGSGGGTAPIKTVRPEVKMQSYYDNRRKQTIEVPEGISPGFAWNPGTAGARAKALGQSYREKDQELVRQFDGGNATGIPVSKALNNKVAAKKGSAVKRALKAIDSVHGDGALPLIEIRKSRKTGVYGYFLPTRNGGADHIGLAASPHPEFTVIHEVGHFLDQNGFPGLGFESQVGTMPEMKAVLRAIRETDTYKQLDAVVKSTSDRKYWLGNIELWARSYAQYIAVKSGDLVLKDQLDNMLKNERLKQWPHDDFVGVLKAIDSLFEKSGWIREK